MKLLHCTLLILGAVYLGLGAVGCLAVAISFLRRT